MSPTPAPTVVTPPEELDKPTLIAAVDAFLAAAAPPHRDVVVRLLSNVQRDPTNVKFRRLRLGNDKIQAAVVATGGLKLLQHVGFAVRAEAGGEEFAVLDDGEAAVPRVSTLLPRLASPVGADTSATKAAVEAAVATEFKALVAAGVAPNAAAVEALRRVQARPPP